MKRRNPIAKAVKRIPPKVVPDKRRKLLDEATDAEARQDTLTPYMPDDPILAGAWVSAMSWALTHEPTMEAFRADTGNKWQPGRTPIDIMIDRAAGVERAFFLQFAAWFNKNVWGEENAV